MLVQPIISLSNNITLGTNVGSTDNFTKHLEMSLLSVFQTHENVNYITTFPMLNGRSASKLDE